MSDATIRAATEDDLTGIFDIFYLNEMHGVDDPPPRGAVPPWLAHTLATGELLVAERAGEFIGFAGLTIRSGVAFLTDLFVRPDVQSGGVGRALLRAILPTDVAVTCTLASSDPRALALYIRAGKLPQWPNYWLLGESAGLRLAASNVEVAEALPEDGELLRWDREIAGRDRPQDHRFWVREQAGVPLWFRRGVTTIGYGYARFNASIIWHQEALTFGPIGARTPGDALDCALAAVRWGRERASLVRVALPGPHPALRPLLDAGFRISDFDTFVSTSREPFFDPRCYLSTGGETF
jgi:GNAT superfamily N-acetyltransferase